MSISAPPTLTVVGLAGLEPNLTCLHELLSGIDPEAAIAFLVAVPPDVDQGALDIVLKSLKVEDLEDQAQLLPGKIYLVAPGSTLCLSKNGVATVEKIGDGPVDDMVLTAIADNHGSDAVGILLSGRHGAGALGIRAILHAGGLTMMEPLTGRKQQSLLHEVDHILGPSEIAKELNFYAQRKAARASRVSDMQTELQAALPEICRLVHDVTGHDLRQYKKLTLLRRIHRLLQVKHLDSAAEFVEFLKTDDQSVRRLLDEVLIQVTSFFRDREAFAYLGSEVIKPLLQNRDREQELRVWVPGCCTGEEVYTIAILFCEALDLNPRGHRVRLFGTDVSQKALAAARRGEYPLGIEQHVSPERLKRFFQRQADRYVVSEQIREMCLFAGQNLVADPPFSDIDLISCRNLMIYLETSLQKKLLSIFHYSLKPNAYLFLGPTEHLPEPNNLFRNLSSKFRISQRRDVDAKPWLSFEPTQPGRGRALDDPSAPSFSSPRGQPTYLLSQKVLLQDFAPPYAVVGEDGGISYLFGETREFLNPSVDFGIEQMARSGLQRSLRTTLAESRRTHKRAVSERGTVETPEGRQSVRLTVQPLLGNGDEQNYMVVFQKLDKVQALEESEATSAEREGLEDRQTSRRLEQELSETRLELDSAFQAHRATHEELKSYNEELRSMNEELQSSNEELRLSQGETQAAVLQAQTAQTDLQNLLDSTEIATVFVDRSQRVQGFTPAATEILNIIPSDIGRPYSHLTHSLESMPPLPPADTEKSELALRGLDGRSYLRRVLPYRRLDKSVHGSVITFIDVTVLKETQNQLRATQEDHAAAVLEHAGREEQLVQARDLAVAASDLKTRFHASISHELRTPLVGLSGMVEILLASRLTNAQMDCVHTIQDCADSLRNLVDDLLDLARIEIDKLVLHPKNCNLEDFIERLLKPFSCLSEKSGVEIKLEIKGTPSFLFFDPARLQQILNNLISNSLKFTSVGSVVLEISCSHCTEDTARVKFCVSDSGRGISEEEGQLIFLPFVQGVEGSRGRHGGIGLGLSISRQLVSLMGGCLDFQSELGEGSRFWFEVDLPIGEAFESERSPVSKLSWDQAIKGRILLAEDNAISQRVIKIQLEKLGHSVVAVEDGLKVLEWLEENEEPFDLVILDCQMPRLDGYETARRIRSSQSSFASVPIMALTAMSGEEEQASCTQAGMDSFLQKPASLDRLGESIQELLSRPKRGQNGSSADQERRPDKEVSSWKQ